MATFDFVLDNDDVQKLKGAISNKLNDLSALSDDVLPEYILVMVQNKKGKHQVAQDLEAFLGKDARIFAEWLWDFLSAMNKSTNTSSEKPPQKREHTRLLSSVVAPAQEEWMTEDRHRTRYTSEQRGKNFERRERKAETKRHPESSRLILSAVQ